MSKEPDIKFIGLKEKNTGSLLIKAFILAIFLHLFPMFIFYVSPIRIDYSNQKPHPTQAVANIKETILQANVDDAFVKKELKKIPLMHPSYFNDPWSVSSQISLEKLQESIFLSCIATDTLDSIDRKTTLKISLPQKRTYPFATLKVSGPLSSCKTNLDEIKLLTKKLNLKTEDISKIRASFDVIASSDNGSIIWYHEQEPIKNQFIRDKAKEILDQLRFININRLFLVSGNIEITFTYYKK